MPAPHDDPDADDPDTDDPDTDNDDDDVFTLGRRSDELSPEDVERRRSSRRVALVALVLVVLIVGVSITLVSLLVDTSSGPPSSPAQAAQQWAQDLVHGHTSARRGLECAAGAAGVEDLQLILAAPTGARAAAATRTGASQWQVPVRFYGPRGEVEVTYSVTVVHRGGRYLVC